MIASDKDAPATARRFLDGILASAPDELRGRARQVVTELVTNSVVHAGGKSVWVEVWTGHDGSFDVVVSDEGPGFEFSPRVAGHADSSGWGSTLVDMLSERWESGGPGRPWVGIHLEPRDERTLDEPRVEGDPLDGRIRELLDVRMVLDSVKDYGILSLDTEGRIALWNAGAERLTGFSASEVLGAPLSLLHEKEADPLTGGDLATALAHGRHEHQYWVRRKDGSRFWADCVLTPIVDGAGTVRGFTDVMRDVTWRKQIDEDREGLIRQINQLARTDDLTGLPNRRRWQEELARELARARRHTSTVCVAMVDLDGLKELNDTYGHLAGDDLLRRTSGHWSQALRATDMLARYGGDEFAVVLPDCMINEALVVIERLRAATPDPATCSAGLACCDGTETADSFVGRADAALYEAKRRGKNTVAVAS